MSSQRNRGGSGSRSATTDDFGRTVLSEPLLLNMAQAAQQEWDLPAVISAINADVMAFAEAQALQLLQAMSIQPA